MPWNYWLKLACSWWCNFTRRGFTGQNRFSADFNPIIPVICCVFITSYLYDSSAQSRHFCQFLQRLSVGVVVLSKLRLHHLQGHTLVRCYDTKRNTALYVNANTHTYTHIRAESTCSCSAVNDVRALLAGFGWQSWSEGSAPSSVSPVPFKKNNGDNSQSQHRAVVWHTLWPAASPLKWAARRAIIRV